MVGDERGEEGGMGDNIIQYIPITIYLEQLTLRLKYRT